MASVPTSLNAIEEFLAQKRIAFVGLSREPRNIGTTLVQEFEKRGCMVLPVNPKVDEISGHRCYARVQDIQPPPDAVLLLTSPQVTDAVIRDCAEAGIRRVWMYRGGGRGAVSTAAVKYCQEHGIDVVAGQCPLMYLDPVHGVHWFHRFLVKITGYYPHRT